MAPIKSIAPMFKTEMLIYQSNVNLDEKILLGEIIHFSDSKIGKIVRGLYQNRTFNVPFTSMIYFVIINCF